MKNVNTILVLALLLALLCIMMGASLGHRSERKQLMAHNYITLSSGATCILHPEETEGPYYVSGMPYRQNITEGKPGVPLILEVTVVDVTTCEVYENAIVEIWHCDALGIYSHYEAASNGQQGAATDDTTYLRGKQYTNSSGIATFHSIYPGWYVSRDTHIHTKVHIGGNIVHTGQFFFNDTLGDQVGLLYPYNTHNVVRTRLEEDNIYGDDGYYGMLTVTQMGSTLSDGLVATITVGVDPSNTEGGSGGNPGASPSNGAGLAGAESSDSTSAAYQPFVVQLLFGLIIAAVMAL